jgi:uridylate kinase
MTTVISLGGSIVAPDRVDVTFLADFALLIKGFLEREAERRFVIVTGGGSPARVWQKAYREIAGGQSLDTEADWIGVAATRLNAELVRAVFAPYAKDRVVHDPSADIAFTGRVLVGAGWKPGFSSDYDAALLAARFDASGVINLSNIAKVYTADPKEKPDAHPIDKISWADFRKIVGDEWTPGKNLPFDPVASAFAEKEKLQVICVAGRDLENVRKILSGESFVGTTIGELNV